MIHEQYPSAVPRCDTVHTLACTINELQDKAANILTQGFTVLTIEQVYSEAPDDDALHDQPDDDPELTAFLGALGVCSFDNEPNPFTRARLICIDAYDKLQGHIKWHEDALTYHTLQHRLGDCSPPEDSLEPMKQQPLHMPGFFFSPTNLPSNKPAVPRPRTPL